MYQLYDLVNLHDQSIRDEIKKRFSKIVDTNAFVEGEYNTKFETEFAEMQSANFCRLVANGTDAIEIALKAYDIGHGDLVAIPGITFYATAEAVFNIGATPILVDVEEESGLMCPKSLERVVSTYDIKAAIPVHIYGLPCKMDEINHICRKSNIAIIEDAAQASGTITPLGPAGANPHSVATFSFYPTKNLSAMGDAGAILSHDADIIKKIEIIRNHGRGGVGEIGRNSRCDHIQASVLHHKLSFIEEQNQKRKEVASLYMTNITNPEVKLLPGKFIKTSSWHLFPMKVKNNEVAKALVSHLKEKNIASSDIYYAKSMGLEPALDGVKGEREVANSLAGKTVCIPITPFLTKEDVLIISSAVNLFSYGKTKNEAPRPQL